MRECENSNINVENLSEKNEEEKIEAFQFRKRKLIIGQWVDVKDTIEQWLEAQVIDLKDNRAYIHYNGWGTRWDEWIDMESDRIMPFRYYTKQTTFYNYNSPFPNVKPDANVNVYNQNDNQQHQFYDFFNDLSTSFDYCRNIFEKINANREFIGKNNSQGNKEFFHNNIKINNEDTINKKINKINFGENNESKNLIIIPDIKEESKYPEDNLIEDFSDNNLDVQKLNKTKQREIFIYSKRLSPLLDRLGKVMTDMGLYIYHNMKNNKLEE